MLVRCHLVLLERCQLVVVLLRGRRLRVVREGRERDGQTGDERDARDEARARLDRRARRGDLCCAGLVNRLPASCGKYLLANFERTRSRLSQGRLLQVITR